jgi:predicted RNA-binding protein with RPS1 domain
MMKSIQKMIGVLSCTLLLGLGLSPLGRADTPTETADELKAEQSDRRQGGQEAGEQQMSGMKKEAQSQEGKTVKGKVLRIEGGNWFLKEENGKEIQVHVDQTTQQYPKKIDGKNMKGVQIEAMVNDQNHALSIRSSDRRDDRHDHSSKTAGKKAK